MKDVIDKLLAAEAEAARGVQEAREAAESLEREARRQADEVVSRAREAAGEEGARLIATAREEAEADKRRRFEAFQADLGKELALDPAVAESVVAAMVCAVVGAADAREGGAAWRV